MNVLHLSLILKARVRTVALVTALTLAAAGIASVAVPKTYTASTSLILNYKGANHVTGNGTPALVSSGYFLTYVATQIDIIKSPTLALRVVKRLNLTSAPEYRAKYASEATADRSAHGLSEWIANKLLGKIDIKPSHDSSVITLSFSAPDRAVAAATANAFADEYRNMSIEIEAKPAMMAAGYLYTQLEGARRAMEASLSAMALFQEETGIVSQESSTDVETARLSELSTQLVGVQSQLMEAQSKTIQVTHGSAAETPDIANNALIQSLKSDLSKAQTKLSSVTEIVTPEHPNAAAAKAEVVAISDELARQTLLMKASLSANTAILAKREAVLRGALAQQRQKVLSLNQKRTQLTLMAKEVDNRTRIYDALSQRLAQTSIQSQAHQPDVAILSPATAPLLPSNPRKLVVLAVGGLAGLLVGACGAFLQEFFDRRIRSTDDLIRITCTPIIVELGNITPTAIAGPEKFRLLTGATLAGGH